LISTRPRWSVGNDLIGGVPVKKGTSAEPALKYFYMIHRVGRLLFPHLPRSNLGGSNTKHIKLKNLDALEGKKNKLFADHVTQVCEAHNRVIVSFLQQVHAFARPSTEGSREKIGHNVHV